MCRRSGGGVNAAAGNISELRRDVEHNGGRWLGQRARDNRFAKLAILPTLRQILAVVVIVVLVEDVLCIDREGQRRRRCRDCRTRRSGTGWQSSPAPSRRTSPIPASCWISWSCPRAFPWCCPPPTLPTGQISASHGRRWRRGAWRLRPTRGCALWRAGRHDHPRVSAGSGPHGGCRL